MAEDNPVLRNVDDSALPSADLTSELDRLDARLKNQLSRYPQPDRVDLVGSGSAEALLARRLLAERRQREALFGADLFGEPAWDMLLDLYAAHEEQVTVSISSLCIAASVPSTTALRWISVLVASGYIVRKADPLDRRRTWVELTPKAIASMQQLLRGWAER